MMFFNLWHSGLLGKMSLLEILALLYQLIILGPLVRYVFGKFIKGKDVVLPFVNKSV
ncbi:hypothetical protein [Paenibacillus polymyxa]|uniref:hypothetical protein n=1 Tax=Paenibacillus polymyxa TaxID=1406 RepID=UPI002035AB6E|nr:hypothetical protein [Paenibacillus polymyxa]